MKPSVRGKRGKQKTLALSRHIFTNSKSPNHYLAIDKMIANFETTYFNVVGTRIEVMYRKGHYYFGKVRWNHDRLEKELLKLLIREREMYLTSNQIGDTNARRDNTAGVTTNNVEEIQEASSSV